MLISEDKLKDLLVDSEYIKESDFEMTRKEAAGKEVSLQRLLVEKGLVKDENLGRIVADETGYEYADLKKANVDEITIGMLHYIPEVVAYSQRAIVFDEDNEAVKVATSNPENYEFFKLLEKKAGKEVEVFYATPFDMDQALKRYRGDLLAEMKDIIQELEDPQTDEGENIVKLVDLILEYAHSNMASDIHIEPLSEFTIIRFRIDGILHKVADYPKKLHNRVVSRIKIMSKLRTDEKAAAQDGKFQYQTTGGDLDIRVSIMPTTEGENAVLRLLMQKGKRFTIGDLGLLEHDLKKLKAAAKKPHGMIIVVGPTGSGKTTTLYSVLQMLNDRSVNIMTIEDPTEYNMEGIQQTQVNPAKDITFPKGLKSIVRQDPDIIMVGEIRDEETVDMALNSAMTGHLVLSTMHANDAATTFPRFLEMGAEPFLVASSLNVSIAQRLTRTICEECKKSYSITKEELAVLKQEDFLAKVLKKVAEKENLKDINFYKGEGCKFCNGTGYDGRTAIFEVLEVTEGIRGSIVQRASADAIKKKAIEEGMTTMIHDGLTKALRGITTFEEIVRATKS